MNLSAFLATKKGSQRVNYSYMVLNEHNIISYMVLNEYNINRHEYYHDPDEIHISYLAVYLFYYIYFGQRSLGYISDP